MTYKKQNNMNTVFLSLGSNLGNRENNLNGAIAELKKIVTVVQQSLWYETAPVGLVKQPNFLNLVVEIQTTLAPEELLQACLDIEHKLGRIRTVRFGPRTIDIDLLFYGDQIQNTTTLTLPHPRLHERAFVLTPLNDIAPDFFHPIFGKTVNQLLTLVSNQEVKLYQPQV